MRTLIWSLALASALHTSLTAAKEQSMAGFEWNAGLGVAALAYPAWRGASESESLVLPAPVFSAWTDNAEIGRSGLQAEKYLGKGWEIRLSGTGSLPVDSDASPLREGLDDLDPTLEIGPALGWTSRPYGNWRLRAESLLRGVFTLDFSKPQWLGWTFQPRLAVHWQQGSLAAENAWYARLAVGPIWAQDKQHRYFYSVTAEEATINPLLRPYEASGGYSGTRTNLALTWVRGRARLSAYVGYDDLRGVAFQDSPLRPEDDYWLVGSFISWRFWGEARPLRFEE